MSFSISHKIFSEFKAVEKTLVNTKSDKSCGSEFFSLFGFFTVYWDVYTCPTAFLSQKVTKSLFCYRKNSFCGINVPRTLWMKHCMELDLCIASCTYLINNFLAIRIIKASLKFACCKMLNMNHECTFFTKRFPFTDERKQTKPNSTVGLLCSSLHTF